MKHWLSKNKKLLARASALTLVALLLFSLIPQAQAGIVTGLLNGIKTFGIQLLMIPLYLAGWLSWLGGVLLNESINYTIVNLRENLEQITGINVAWSVLRDLANISFIFILLYTAIQTILGQSTGKMKSAILGIVVAAILINFSLFFTRVAIDTSNILAITFYTPIENCVVGLEPKDRGLATCLMSMMGLSSTFGAGGELLEAAGGEFSTAAIIALGGAVFLTITFFIFTAIAIMLLIRYINFIYLLIISPIGIAGSVIPGLSKYASDWRSKLISECTFAPAYMLATWVILVVLQGGASIKKIAGDGTNAQKFSGLFESAAGGDGSGMGVVINFIILIGLTLGSLLVAKKFANQSGSMGETLISGGLKFAGMGAAGTGGFLGRRVGGRIGRNLSEREGLKEAAAKGGASGFAARMALKTSRAAGSGSWDLRSSNVMEKYNQGAKALGGQTLDFGKAGGKGGFTKMVEERSKEEVKFAESLKPSDLTVAKAEQALETAKGKEVTLPTDQEYRQEYSNRKRTLEAAEQRHRKAKEMFDSYKAGVDSGVHTYNPRVFKEAKEKMDSAATTLAEARRKAAVPVSGLKEDMKKESQKRKDLAIAQAQEEVDRLKGVNKEDAKKREIETRDSLGATRMKQYAGEQESAAPVSTKRVGLFGRVSREQKEIAVAIRKKAKEKSPKDKLAEAAKAMAKDDTDDTPPATPPPASGPTPPPATPSP